MPDSLPPAIDAQLKDLRVFLKQLPEKRHSYGPSYGFKSFVLDEEWFELTGSHQWLINHSLKVAFGSWHTGAPIEFKSHGPDLVAMVHVLLAHISNEDGENPILIQLIPDLHRAAVHALERSLEPSDNPKRRDLKPSAKQETLNQEENEKESRRGTGIPLLGHVESGVTVASSLDSAVHELLPDVWE